MIPNIQTLAEKAARLFPSSLKSTAEEVSELEEILEVKMSNEFKSGDIIYAYDLFESFDFFSFPRGVIQETLRLRKDANLPKDTLILSEDDASIWLMRCLGDHEEIYWMAVEDYYRYCDNEPLEYNPTIFPTFTDFFSYLLDEEEKRRAEEKVK